MTEKKQDSDPAQLGASRNYVAAKQRYLLQLTSKLDRPVNADRNWARRARQRFLCPGCGAVRLEHFPGPVDVELVDHPEGVAVFVFRAGVTLFRTKFIELVNPKTQQYSIGQCFMRDGRSNRILEEYRTCYVNPNYELVVREAPGGNYRICEYCARAVSVRIALPRYTLEGYKKTHDIYQDSSGTMFIDPLVARQIDWSQFPDAELVPIAVLDSPLDRWQLPGDPDWRATGD